MTDSDVPGDIFTHWLVYNIPVKVNSLGEDVAKKECLPKGCCQGINDFGDYGYGDHSPPPGKTHRFIFYLYALNTKLNLPSGMYRLSLLNVVESYIITEVRLTALFTTAG